MPSIVFDNAKIVTEEKTISNGFLVVTDHRIAQVGEGPATREELAALPRVDCGGQILAPGFIDLHCHGGGGSDFMDGTPEDTIAAARAHLAHGTTTLAPTSMASTDAELFRFLECFEDALRETENMPRLAGVHLEGPYFSAAQAGAQPPELLVDPTPAHYKEILRKGNGHILRWSSAPELDGALALGDELRERGIIASIGHSNATYPQVLEAVRHGYTHVTHLYSGMSTIVRRKGVRVLGVVESAFLLDELYVEIIADGKHLPPELLRLIVKTKDHAHISLVTDSMRGATMPEGPSFLGSRSNGLEVIIKNDIANMPDFSGFAGSVATTDRLVRTMVQQAGLPLHEAVNMASLHPARLIHRDREVGSIAPGKLADLVLLDEGLHAAAVYVGGERVSL